MREGQLSHPPPGPLLGGKHEASPGPTCVQEQTGALRSPSLPLATPNLSNQTKALAERVRGEHTLPRSGGGGGGASVGVELLLTGGQAPYPNRVYRPLCSFYSKLMDHHLTVFKL